MVNIKRTIKTPLRWRKARGFGIHSPFAFAFVRGVLREHMAYYAYPEISALRRRRRRTSPPTRILRLIFRVVVNRHPSRAVVVSGCDAEALKATLALADSRMAVVDSAAGFEAADLVVVDATCGMPSGAPDLQEAYSAGATMVLLNLRNHALRDMYVGLKEAMQRGMTFTNDADVAVVIPDAHLPRQDFTLRL